MPFKIGDKFRNDSLGLSIEIVAVHGSGSNLIYEGTRNWDTPTITEQANGRWTENTLTRHYYNWKKIEEPKKERFEVGKRYEGVVSHIVRECIWVDDVGAILLCRNDPSYYTHKQLLFYTEYVPPPPKPVHHEGWITVGKQKEVFATKEDAERYVETWTNNQSTHLKCIVKIEWDEPVAVVEDDDTI